MSDAAPDLLEAVVGYRAWYVDDEGWLLPFSLGSIAGPWRPGVNHATCHFKRWRGGVEAEAAHPAPAPGCMCGLYALTESRDPRLTESRGDFAVGAIGAWGELEVHRAGFRAEQATVLALAIEAHTSPFDRIRIDRAAKRYGVPVVPRAALEATALRHGAPVPASLLPTAPAPVLSAAAARIAAAPAGRGIRLAEHVWFDASSGRCGITRAFAGRFAPGPVDLVLPGIGDLRAVVDPLARLTVADRSLTAWAPLTAAITAVNPGLLDDPGAVLRDPEGAGWLAVLTPKRWAAEAGELRWGLQAARAYATHCRAVGAFDELCELPVTAPGPILDGLDVLTELRRRRGLPRFAGVGDVERHLVAPMAAALAAEPARARRLARLGTRVAFVLRDPSAAVVLDARAPPVTVGIGDPLEAGVVFMLEAEALERFFDGRLDLPRALRDGSVRSSVVSARTLAVASVLTDLPPVRSRPPAGVATIG